uniref:Lectin-like protein n=1 Tax=Gracilaria fisheri TaxID=1232878 RepID=E3SER7_9FLOR|nr:lectin-like protein [Hydropuntia fisheri]
MSVLFVLLLLALHAPPIPAEQLSRQERQRQYPKLFEFPYLGAGDVHHTFRQPYEPSPAGDPVNGWFQLGTTMITRSRSGRDVVRLTSASQANQAIFYNAIPTDTQNFNGYFDVEMDTVRDSHEPADGMGFFFTRDRPRLGSAMGMSHTFVGLALIIDTFSNSRSRNVPYMYAYVSDGTKEWNPDTDGADTELTKGCTLEMNHPIRVYVQFVDGDLHVGVAMNPRSPQRWHTCFKASGVRLPFSGGGHLAFAAETGHFYANHEVHDAVFIDEPASATRSYQDDYYSQQYGTGGAATNRQQQYNADNSRTNAASSSSSGASSAGTAAAADKAPEYRTDPDPAARIHRGADAHTSLSGSLDLQVYEVYNSVSAMLKGLGDENAQETKLKLEGVRDITGQLIREMEKQKSDLSQLVDVLRHLKDTAGDLSYASDRFSSQLQGLHNSLRTLKEKTHGISDSHDELHDELIDHHDSIMEQSSGGSSTLLMFVIVQALLGIGVYHVNKMTLASRKVGRMV